MEGFSPLPYIHTPTRPHKTRLNSTGKSATFYRVLACLSRLRNGVGVALRLSFFTSTNKDVIGICCQVQPHLATLVPERREEVPTDGGLDYHNYPTFKQIVPHVREVSIGFAVVARAVLVGMEHAVREMRLLVKGY